MQSRIAAFVGIGLLFAGAAHATINAATPIPTKEIAPGAIAIVDV